MKVQNVTNLSGNVTLANGIGNSMTESDVTCETDKQRDACVNIQELSNWELTKDRYIIAANLSIALTIPSIFAFILMHKLLHWFDQFYSHLQ